MVFLLRVDDVEVEMNDVALFVGNIFKSNLEENVFTRESARAFERGTRRGKVRGRERGSTIGITT